MRNLWLFILRNNAFFLFIIFESAAIVLLVQHNRYQKASVVNSANQITGTIYSKADQVSRYLMLGKVNDSLAMENARLRSRLENAFYDTDTTRVTIQDTVNLQQYTYITARVVNNTITYRSNWLTLNRGAADGVKSGMGIMGPHGIAGIIKDVSEHFSTAYSILHKDVRVSVKLDSSNNIGSLVWPGVNPMLAAMEDVPTHVQVNKGERLVTTGFSLFPEGTPVGTVVDVKRGGTKSFLGIDVKLATNFQQLQYVYIVVNKFQEEQEQLEEKLEQ
ncbi:rod shape-determining protein MreC [Anseongella ginsenosidimutans]|uniref:Cell shape-determining protein MreC n=1 Tax=Anseongella ginsenosidimutans TaxID=496056 RepID=A0A4R3KXX9_9SPHI|nr:rod shape-determining protein MreC [Anseongella ginsenosidimutans]QEC51061.1 rod shape-determining protein MreC [Anseongella ginsenosidimutans]TCS90281.1 rod shape-determining protein MreC [Anseongella ginsenosidimutans]